MSTIPATDLGRFTDLTALLASPFSTAGTYSDATATGKLTGLTASASMMGQFRTKGLRNVAGSGPYMHAGQLATFADVIDHYDRGGGDAPDGGTKDPALVALGLTADEKTDLAAFLGTLTGEDIPAALLADTSAP